MKLRFLGTGAADFSELLETDYKDTLDRNARRSSAALIDGRLLIDCGPHTLDSLRLQKLDCSGITDLLVTHFHSDHYNRENVARLAAMCAQPLRMWYHEDAQPEPIDNVQLHPVKPLKTFCADKFRITPLAANHTAFPLHYDIESEGIRLFYGCDGAWLLNETFYAMVRRQYRCMILDATVGDYNGDYRLAEHNSIPMIRLMTEAFRSQKVIAENGILCLSHLARTLHNDHDQTASQLEKEGYTVAYDGLELNLLS